jgi:hypothetical protein
VIKPWATTTVPDMMGYMKALGMFKKGDTAQVTVLRDGKEDESHVLVHFK